MKRLIAVLNCLTEASGVLFLVIMLGVLLLQIFCRYILNNALAYPEEVARFTFLWATYAGISVAVREKRHLRIEILPVLLPKRCGKPLSVLCETLNVLFFAYFVAISHDMVLEIHAIGVEGVAVPLALWTVWLALPVYGTLCALNALANLMDMFTLHHNKNEVSA